MNSLADQEKGFEGSVVQIDTNDERILKKLMAMGVFPGSSIELIQNFPSFVFQVGYTQVAVDKKIASTIIVK